MCEEDSVTYLRDLCREKELLDRQILERKDNPDSSINLTNKLLTQEISRVQSGGRPPGRENRLLDVYNEKPVRVTAKILVPVKEHPRFNFVGKLLGPRGNSLKKLQDDTMTKMAILGKGSIRNKQHEEELRKSGDAKHHHLQEDLHVEVTAFASPAEAYARIAMALAEIRKYLIPDGNDEIRQRQMKEIQILKKQQAQDPPNDQDRQQDDSGQESDVSSSPKSNPPSPVSSLPPSSTGLALSPPPSQHLQPHQHQLSYTISTPQHNNNNNLLTTTIAMQQQHAERSSSPVRGRQGHQDSVHYSPPPVDNKPKVYDPRSRSILDRIRQNRGSGDDILDRTSSVATVHINHADLMSSSSTATVLQKLLPLHLKEKLKRDVDTAFLNETAIIEQQPWKKIK